jgi:hypothetical protein
MWKISVVVLARTQSLPVLRALESIAALKKEASIEVVVVNCCGERCQRRIAERFPKYAIINVPPTASTAQARFAGVVHSTGDIVAMVAERYTVSDSWLAALEKGHESEVEVVGGPVAVSVLRSWAEWAMFLVDYAHATPPLSVGLLNLTDAKMLPGGNVSYKRRAFQMASMEGALWELDFHEALYRAGARFVRRNEMQAEFASPYTLHEFLMERRRVSHDLAAMRVRGMSAPARLFAAVVWLALPPVLIFRTLRHSLAKPSLRRAVFGALPLVVRFSFVQTAAEIRGILTAKSGAAAARSLGTSGTIQD